MKTQKSKLKLQVNNAETIQVNITTQVNSQSIRKIEHNGRPHWVLPSYTLPANVVMNGGLYTAAEIDKHYAALEGTLAPLGHPEMNGAHISAFSAEAINSNHVGAYNRNVKKSGNRIYLEKWVDVEVAERTEGGRRLLERVEAIANGQDVPPIHTSVAAFLERMEANEEQRKMGAEWVAHIHAMDHDAILLDEVGAATPEQGVGLMVNADQAKPLQPNSGALVGESYREREQRLDRAAKARFAAGENEHAWVVDFTDSQAVILRNGSEPELFSYTSEGGQIVFGETGTAVARQESWVVVLANNIQKMTQKIFQTQARPAVNKEGDMPLTPEERAALVQETGEAVAANMTKQLAPLIESIQSIQQQTQTLQANQSALAESLQANQKAEEAAKRAAVAEKLGEVIANALTGEALEDAYKRIGTAAPLAGNSADNSGTGLKADVAHLPKE